jgi:Domain of unknown function (DUF1877)
MSMVVVCFQASDATIDRIAADPPLVWQLVAPDEPEFYSDARAASVGMLGKLFGRKRPVEPLQLAEHEGELGDLDKAWHGIDFLLTRGRDAVAHGLDFLTEGGIEIRGQEVGYGPARAFRSTEVRAIARELSALSDDVLRTRFDPATMTAEDVYPNIWDRTPPDEDPLAYLMENVRTLRQVMQTLVDSGNGLVITLQ